MKFEFDRWYTFCQKHKPLVAMVGKWEEMPEPTDGGGYPETCDWLNHDKKRCKKPAQWEFSIGPNWQKDENGQK